MVLAHGRLLLWIGITHRLVQAHLAATANHDHGAVITPLGDVFLHDRLDLLQPLCVKILVFCYRHWLPLLILLIGFIQQRFATAACYGYERRDNPTS